MIFFIHLLIVIILFKTSIMKAKTHAFLVNVLFILFLFPLLVQGQSGEKKAVPPDPTLRTGTLENGLKYYIKSNLLPENRAEFYLINNVGAILETPGQNGLAHFTEHMCFNGTKNFKKHEIIHYLQSIGMKFGPEINAYTTADETVYTLNTVPVNVPANIDTSLMILYDWACNVSFDDQEIDNERGVILEEWRTRRSPQFRMSTRYNKVLFHGSKYAIHDVIGSSDIIEHFQHDTLRQFYKDWYRPDLQAIIVVGDIDVVKMEQKVKKMFSTIPVHKNEKERRYFPIPDHQETLVAIEKDKEAPYTIVQVHYKHDPDPDRSQAYYRNEYVNNLYSVMINARLSEKLQSPNPPFLYAFSGYNSLTRTKDAYTEFAVVPNEKITSGLEALMTENERVKKYGFTTGELERAKKQVLAQIEKIYNERDKQKSGFFASLLQDNFLTGEPVPGIEWEYNFVKNVLPGISLSEINSLAGKWITDKNCVIIVTGPDKEGMQYPTKEELLALAGRIKTKEIQPYKDQVVNVPLVLQEPVPGTVKKEQSDSNHGIIRWELSNGVKVVLKPTDFKDDEILMAAQSPGGWSKYSQSDDISAGLTTDVVTQGGVGDFNLIALQKKLAGKVVQVSPILDQLSEGFSGSSNQKDFETLLKLTYLYFTQPRIDQDAYQNLMKRYKGILENKSKDPSAAFNDSITVIMAQHNSRMRPMTAQLLDEANLERIRAIYQDRFKDPSGFTFYFVGNLDMEKVKPLILKYLGGLPATVREENWNDLGIRMPGKKITKIYHRDLKTPKSTVYMSYTGRFKYQPEERLLLQAVKEYLDIRMIETLREEQGGTYGASLWTNTHKYPEGEYSLNIFFDCNPVKTDTLIGIVYDEVNKLIKKGPDPKNITNIIENKLKEHKETIKENTYWLNVLENDDFNREDYLNFDYNKFWQELTPKQVQKAARKYLKPKSVVQLVQTSNPE